MNSSTIRRVQIVQGIVRDYYEPGRQDRNKHWVWRTQVRPLLGISLRTFSRYINLTPEEMRPHKPQPVQYLLPLEW